MAEAVDLRIRSNSTTRAFFTQAQRYAEHATNFQCPPALHLMPTVTLPLILAAFALAIPGSNTTETSHPISITEAQIFVTGTSARVRIKLFAEDLNLFHELEANEFDNIPPGELRRGLELHRAFLLEKFTLRNAKGEAYDGQVVDLQAFEIPEEGIPIDDLMLHTATYALEYPFAEPPEFLTIQQDISDENFILPSEMKLTLHQSGTELTYTESLKPGESETLRFDWSDTQLTSESSDEEWEKWFEKQREETLGITSYSSVYSFIYIEPAEVRHEVLIPLANLKMVLPMKHQDPAFIDVDEQEGVRTLIKDWLTGVNPTVVNGLQTEPEFSRIDFYGLDLKDFAKQSEARKVSLTNGRVGIIMTYRPNEDCVRSVDMTWDKFHSSVVRKIQSVVFSYPDTLSRFEFSRFNEAQDNVLHWVADESILPKPIQPMAVKQPPPAKLSLPIGTLVLCVLALIVQVLSPRSISRTAISLLIIGGVMWPFLRTEVDDPFRPPTELADSAADEVFQSLHKGAYRALDFGTEERIYEALETAVDGQLLESLYLQFRESLAMKEQGGAVARVQSLTYGDTARQTPTADTVWPGFRYRSRWTVSGTVEHWGHVHERQNQFCAVFNIEPRDGFWKITDMQIEEQESVSSKPRLRKF